MITYEIINGIRYLIATRPDGTKIAFESEGNK